MTRLRQLVNDLDRAQRWDDPPFWAQVIGPNGCHVLLGADMEQLMGFVAPPACSAVAVVAGGWTCTTEGSPRRAAAERERCRLVMAVARDGEVAGVLRWSDGTYAEEPPESGSTLDILRRCLRLPTDPPAVPPGVLLAAQWLYDIIQLARGRYCRVGWEQVAARHPAMQAARLAGRPVGASDLVAVARAGASVWSWSRLLRLAAGPGHLADSLPPGAGSWMDEGMLSRWLLAIYSPLDAQIALVGSLLGPGTARRVHGVLDELGLLATASRGLCSPAADARGAGAAPSGPGASGVGPDGALSSPGGQTPPGNGAHPGPIPPGRRP